ncbi:MAG: metabolite traffic protein EboE [Pirellula sp.]|jgi:sugar phosphate isomerase/epimerase|nr:metabolite traffic protein EboE [Pirellula sp.]
MIDHDKNMLLGYCTNVHAGIHVDAILENLRTHALKVRKLLGIPSLPVGLWFSETAAREALNEGRLQHIRQELQDMGLVPYTFNGFPQGDFHSQIVKHRVYLPTWWEPSRLDYTRDLVQLLDSLLEPGRFGSISTLPIGWGTPQPTGEQWTQAATRLVTLAEELHQRFEASGRLIVVALEPEPGCAITDTASLRRFFSEYLSESQLGSATAARVRQHVTMCHDICHAAVMCEDQETELLACQKEGIRVGKVQISSAIRVCWDALAPQARIEALDQIRQFAEDRYLHQTMILTKTDGRQLVEDLPALLSSFSERSNSVPSGEWRIHFHVPVDVAAWGHIESTHGEIDTFLEHARNHAELFGPDLHLEVETYAWGVLPEAMRTPHLYEGIAREIRWVQSKLS